MTHAYPYESVPTTVPSIFAVVVLYKMLPAQSPSLRTLFEAARSISSDALRLEILIVDNTPGGQFPGTLAEGVQYQAAPNNPGLAVAYNGALATAAARGFSWLLTLDQDTTLPTKFFTLLLHQMKYLSDKEVLSRGAGAGREDRIAVLAGHMVDGARALAPFRFFGGFWPVILPRDFSGLAHPYTSTLNSASLLRISALQEIGGYDERFPLNNSDTSLFHRLGEAGRRMYVIGELIIPHELAIMDREQRMTPERYRQLLADERACWDLYMNPLARAERLIKLAGRLVKGLLQGEGKEFRSLTFEELRYRLLTSRRQRMEAWQRRQSGTISTGRP